MLAGQIWPLAGTRVEYFVGPAEGGNVDVAVKVVGKMVVLVDNTELMWAAGGRGRRGTASTRPADQSRCNNNTNQWPCFGEKLSHPV